MPDALSVDALCGFGAKNFIRCTEFIQRGHLADTSTSLLISHFGVFCVLFGSVMVRFDEKCLMSGREFDRLWILGPALTWFVVKQVAIAGMLPSCRLVRRLSGWALS
ncbi:hypothetical protein ACYZUD_30360 [Pseudomonas sp. XS1P51]